MFWQPNIRMLQCCQTVANFSLDKSLKTKTLATTAPLIPKLKNLYGKEDKRVAIKHGNWMKKENTLQYSEVLLEYFYIHISPLPLELQQTCYLLYNSRIRKANQQAEDMIVWKLYSQSLILGIWNYHNLCSHHRSILSPCTHTHTHTHTHMHSPNCKFLSTQQVKTQMFVHANYTQWSTLK